MAGSTLHNEDPSAWHCTNKPFFAQDVHSAGNRADGQPMFLRESLGGRHRRAHLQHTRLDHLAQDASQLPVNRLARQMINRHAHQRKDTQRDLILRVNLVNQVNSLYN